jgi:hypothetical protein
VREIPEFPGETMEKSRETYFRIAGPRART